MTTNDQTSPIQPEPASAEQPASALRRWRKLIISLAVVNALVLAVILLWTPIVSTVGGIVEGPVVSVAVDDIFETANVDEEVVPELTPVSEEEQAEGVGRTAAGDLSRDGKRFPRGPSRGLRCGRPGGGPAGRRGHAGRPRRQRGPHPQPAQGPQGRDRRLRPAEAQRRLLHRRSGPDGQHRERTDGDRDQPLPRAGLLRFCEHRRRAGRGGDQLPVPGAGPQVLPRRGGRSATAGRQDRPRLCTVPPVRGVAGRRMGNRGRVRPRPDPPPADTAVRHAGVRQAALHHLRRRQRDARRRQPHHHRCGPGQEPPGRPGDSRPQARSRGHRGGHPAGG